MDALVASTDDNIQWWLMQLNLVPHAYTIMEWTHRISEVFEVTSSALEAASDPGSGTIVTPGGSNTGGGGSC
jgi:hypothetical protein